MRKRVGSFISKMRAHRAKGTYRGGGGGRTLGIQARARHE